MVRVRADRFSFANDIGLPDERSRVRLRPVGYEHLFCYPRRLDGDSGYVHARPTRCYRCSRR